METASAFPTQQCQGQAFLLRLSFLTDACLCALACILTYDMVLCMHATHNIFKTVAKVASLCSLLQIGVGGAPWVRLTPSNATAEVTSPVLVVALTAQRCILTITPALRRDSVGCTAIVAEPSCPEPAVNAWTAQHLFRSEALDIHTSNAHHCKTGCNNSVGCNQMA